MSNKLDSDREAHKISLFIYGVYILRKVTSLSRNPRFPSKRIPQLVLKGLILITFGFQQEHRPPERLRALIAKTSQPGRRFYKVSTAKESRHAVSCKKIIGGLVSVKNLDKSLTLSALPNPLTFRERKVIGINLYRYSML